MCCATLIFCYEKGNTAQNIASLFDNNMYLISDFRVYEIIIWTKDNVSLFHQLPCSIIWAGLWNKQNWHEHKAISVCHNCWCADKQQKMYYCFLILNTLISNAVIKFTRNLQLTGAFVIQKSWQFLKMNDNTCIKCNTEMPMNKKINKDTRKDCLPSHSCWQIDECRLFEVLDCKYWKYTLFFFKFSIAQMNAYLPMSLKRGIGRSAKLLQASKLRALVSQ